MRETAMKLIGKESDKVAKDIWLRPALAVWALALLGILAVDIVRAGRSTPQPTNVAPMPTYQESTPPPAPEKCYEIGAVCRLVSRQGTDMVLAATSLQGFEEYRKSADAGDKDGIYELLFSGQLLPLTAGDGIRVLDESTWHGRVEGRMVNGHFQGRRVWVESDRVVH
jgi:hypothetical protein